MKLIFSHLSPSSSSYIFNKTISKTRIFYFTYCHRLRMHETAVDVLYDHTHNRNCRGSDERKCKHTRIPYEMVAPRSSPTTPRALLFILCGGRAKRREMKVKTGLLFILIARVLMLMLNLIILEQEATFLAPSTTAHSTNSRSFLKKKENFFT